MKLISLLQELDKELFDLIEHLPAVNETLVQHIMLNKELIAAINKYVNSLPEASPETKRAVKVQYLWHIYKTAVLEHAEQTQILQDKILSVHKNSLTGHIGRPSSGISDHTTSARRKAIAIIGSVGFGHSHDVGPIPQELKPSSDNMKMSITNMVEEIVKSDYAVERASKAILFIHEGESEMTEHVRKGIADITVQLLDLKGETIDREGIEPLFKIFDRTVLSSPMLLADQIESRTFATMPIQTYDIPNVEDKFDRLDHSPMYDQGRSRKKGGFRGGRRW